MSPQTSKSWLSLFHPLDALLALVPVAAALEWFHAPPAIVFSASALAIVPLAGMMGRSTEQLAERVGPGVGGLLNATFGNAAELIIAIIGLSHGLGEVVKASITGSIIGNSLLVLGLAILAGGIKHPVQTFNKTAASLGSTLMALAAIGMIVPTLFWYAAQDPLTGARSYGASASVERTITAGPGGASESPHPGHGEGERTEDATPTSIHSVRPGPAAPTTVAEAETSSEGSAGASSGGSAGPSAGRAVTPAGTAVSWSRLDRLEKGLSAEIALILGVTYILSLFFSLKTHKHLYAGDAIHPHQAPTEPGPAAANGSAPRGPHGGASRRLTGPVVLLIASSGLVALMSEFLVGSLEPTARALGLTDLFVGVIVVAVIGNAAEHSSAVFAAVKNQMDLATHIAIGSSLQIALFVTPVLVGLSYFIGPAPLDLHFTLFEVGAVVLGVLSVNLVSQDGESNWMEGVLLLAVYAILGFAFYFLPG